MYVNQRELAYSQRRQFEEEPRLRNMTQTQRKLLKGTGLVTVRRTRLPIRAKKQMDELEKLASNSVVICWLDNFAVQRYARNPNEFRDRCINGTVFAKLPVPVHRRDCEAWPTVRKLYQQMKSLVDLLPYVAMHSAMRSGTAGEQEPAVG